VVLLPEAAYAQQQIKVGAWNIQYLGAHNCRPVSTEHTAQRPSDIAKFIIASGVDILGLEEITDDDGQSNTYTNQTLTSVMTKIRETTGDTWDYMLFRKFQEGQGCKAINVQLTGVAWNTRKVKRLEFKRIPIDTSSLPDGVRVWNRPPVAVKFSLGEGKTDIVFIVVHMKSNVGDDTETTREWEARLLVEQLAFVKDHFADDDIVILGDTNVLGGDEAAVLKFTQSGFTDLNAEDGPTTIRQESFDRIFTRTAQSEFHMSEQAVFGPGYLNLSLNKFLRRFSDHYMVTAKVKVATDDDQ
jgi:predicted extracellular nuclease